jgi:hypothetical protein
MGQKWEKSSADDAKSSLDISTLCHGDLGDVCEMCVHVLRAL